MVVNESMAADAQKRVEAAQDALRAKTEEQVYLTRTHAHRYAVSPLASPPVIGATDDECTSMACLPCLW